MSQVESVGKPCPEGQKPATSDSSVSVNRVAPTLRVEELKDEDGQSSSAYSEEEGVLSHGDGSDKGSDKDADNEASGKSSPKPSEAEFVPPDPELVQKMITQVEFYFGDANILKDAFLLKHVRRNKQGYVSLKLITSFRKMKSLSKDYRQVAFSLRQSDELEVNEEGTKVRRRKPLPDYDETTPSRSVVAVNLPFDNPTIENVAELFRPCGIISLIRILRPGKPIPPDVKKHLLKHPELDHVVCAVIEFEHHEAAKSAVNKMTNGGDWRRGLRVVLLGQVKKDKANQAKEDQQTVEGQETEKSADDSARAKEGKKKKNRKKRASRVDELAKEEAGESPSSGSEGDENKKDITGGGDTQEMRRKSSGAGIPPSVMARASLSPNVDVNRLSPSTTPRSSPRNTPRSSPRSSPRGSPNLRRKVHGKSPLATNDGLSPGTSPKPSPCASPELARRRKSSLEMGTSPGGSPWVQRRLKAQQEAGAVNGRSPGTSPRLGRRLLDLEGVIRQPKGPDGSAGFYGGVGRGKPVASAV